MQRTNSKELPSDLGCKEAQLLAQLEHPNVMRYVDFYEQEEQFCIVTAHYEGLDLYEALRQRSSAQMNEFEAAEIVKQILEAVQYL